MATRALAARGLEPADIGTVVLSHGHWDHVQNVDFFQEARVLLHADELDNLENPPSTDLGTPRGPADLDDLDVQVTGEGDEPLPGVKVLDLPGHTPGSIGLAVSTEAGTAVLSADAVPTLEVLRARTASGRPYDRARADASIERVAELADLVYPGTMRVPARRERRTAVSRSSGTAHVRRTEPGHVGGGRMTQTGGQTASMLEDPPEVDVRTAAELLRSEYGLDAVVTELRSERDRNFLAEADGRRLVVKVSNTGDDADQIAMECAAMDHVAAVDPDLPIPRLIPSTTGESVTTVQAADGRTHLVRVITVLPGDVADLTALPSWFAADFGVISARLTRALQGSGTRRRTAGSTGIRATSPACVRTPTTCRTNGDAPCIACSIASPVSTKPPAPRPRPCTAT